MPKDIFTDFSGGINKVLPPIIVPGNIGEAMKFCEDCSNFEASESGLLKYLGQTQRLSSALSGTPNIMGIFEYKKTDGTLVLVVCAGGKVYTVSGGSATQIYTGGTADKPYIADQFNNVLILCNGTDTPLYYDGTTCTTITFTDPQTIWNNAKPLGVSVVGNRVFYWNDTTQKDRVYTPKPGTYNNFDNSNNTVDAFDVAVGTGGGITGLKSLTNNAAVIYKQNSIHRLTGSAPFGAGTDEFTLTDITRSHGCIAPRTIISVDADQYFLSAKGYVSLSAVQRFGDLSYGQPDYKIKDLITALNYTQSVIERSCAVFLPQTNRIYLSVPGAAQTTNTKLYVFDLVTDTCEQGTWTIAASMGVYNRAIYTGGYNGLIYEFGTGNAYGSSSIAGVWESKWIAHQGDVYKRYKSLKVYAESLGESNIIFKWGILRRGSEHQNQTTKTTSSGSLWDTAKWDEATWGSSGATLFRKKNLGRGTAFKLYILNTSTTQRPIIRKIELEYDIFGENLG